MKVLTKAQRVALKRVFDRNPANFRVMDVAYNWEFCPRDVGMVVSAEGAYTRACIRLTYRQFRKLAFVSYGALMLHWCGMWLGIEEDGYTHS